jgi:hypothetical protein
LINHFRGEGLSVIFMPGVPPSSIFRQANVHIFDAYTEPVTSDPPSTTCSIHPEASPQVKALSSQQRELIYHETHGHNGCFKALGLFDAFFQLSPPGQTLSIQIRGEVRTR